MEEATVVQRLNESFEDFVTQRQGYQAAYSLLIRWEEADDPGIADEGQRLQKFLEDRLGVIVWSYQIPSERPHAALQLKISQLISTCESSKNSLLILYYAGHGDDKGKENKLIWAA